MEPSAMASPSRPAVELLTQYAEYHRDRRNIVTHFVGVPMIVFAVGVLLSRPGFMLGGLMLSPAWLALRLSVLWYLTRGELLLGVAVSTGIGAAAAAGAPGAGRPGALAGLGTGLLRRRLADPVHRPLLRRPQAGLLPTTWSACWWARCSW
jgi:hypothetical protein